MSRGTHRRSREALLRRRAKQIQKKQARLDEPNITKPETLVIRRIVRNYEEHKQKYQGKSLPTKKPKQSKPTFQAPIRVASPDRAQLSSLGISVSSPNDAPQDTSESIYEPPPPPTPRYEPSFEANTEIQSEPRTDMFTRSHGKPLDFCITTRPHGRRTFTKYVIRSQAEKRRDKRQLARELRNYRKQILGTKTIEAESKESKQVEQTSKQDPKDQIKNYKKPKYQRNQNRGKPVQQKPPRNSENQHKSKSQELKTNNNLNEKPRRRDNKSHADQQQRNKKPQKHHAKQQNHDKPTTPQLNKQPDQKKVQNIDHKPLNHQNCAQNKPYQHPKEHKNYKNFKLRIKFQNKRKLIKVLEQRHENEKTKNEKPNPVEASKEAASSKAIESSPANVELQLFAENDNLV